MLLEAIRLSVGGVINRTSIPARPMPCFLPDYLLVPMFGRVRLDVGVYETNLNSWVLPHLLRDRRMWRSLITSSVDIARDEDDDDIDDVDDDDDDEVRIEELR